MAGTIGLALTQQLDEFGSPLSGGQLFLIQAGTTSTPQNAFQDTALTIPLPNPITLDAAGRIPQFFLADGQIKVRLQDAQGVVKFVADNLLVIGPSAGGGGGGGTVDPTTIWQTGDLKVRYDNVVISGFVRCNGKTIGSVSSPATELAHATAQALFQFLWSVDPNLVVTPGGRGASSIADWTGSKAITLPDWRGRALAALDDMGNTAAGRLTATYLGTSATVLGAAGGGQNIALVQNNLPSVNFTVTLGTITTTISNSGGGTSYVWNDASGSVTPGGATGGPAAATALRSLSAGTSIGPSTAASGGSATPFTSVQPTMLATVYLKL
jgi:hypothetical protein